MRKRVTHPKIKDYLKYSKEYYKADALIHHDIENFNTLVGAFLLIFITGLLSIWNIKLLVFPLSLFCFVLFIYLKIKYFVNSIEVERKVEKRSYVEGDRMTILYHLSHSLSGFNVQGVDHFEGSQKNDLKVANIKNKRLKAIMSLDNGFGDFYFKEIELNISDVFSFFMFKVTFLKKEKIHVSPYIQKIKDGDYTSEQDSFSIGEYDYIQKGFSPIFYGLREYRFGDSFKTINWKASTKNQKTIVNEYENIQNLTSNIWLELDPKSHLGEGINSTWEYSRDIALSVLKINNDKNHFVNFSSNEISLDYFSADDLMTIIKKKLSHAKPNTFVNKYNLYDSLERYEQGSDITLIQSLYQCDRTIENIKFLILNSFYFNTQTIYLIDAYTAVKKGVNKELTSRLLVERKNAIDYLDNRKKEFRLLGIKVFIVEVKAPHIINSQMKEL